MRPDTLPIPDHVRNFVHYDQTSSTGLRRSVDVLARTVNVLDAENKELRSDETAAWMIVEPGCEYGPTFGTENAAWSALTKAPPGSELVELIRRKA